MGWTFEYRKPGLSNREFLQAQLAEGYEVIATHQRGFTSYVAIREPSGGITAAVMLTSWHPVDGWGTNFGYKLVPEEHGPMEAECPDRILDLLWEPAPNGWAEEWRKRCRAWNAKRLTKGQIVRFTKPIIFQSGRERQDFEYHRGDIFLTVGDWPVRVSIRGWKDREYEVITNGG